MTSVCSVNDGGDGLSHLAVLGREDERGDADAGGCSERSTDGAACVLGLDGEKEVVVGEILLGPVVEVDDGLSHDGFLDGSIEG
eukprot:CAMPEP_0184359942 /NCGR_PEP_ID=MMETSP1089-20130417/122601_1 /TAXON_ID=38269 ORGANISM="Gloeochaete wittrockiana, Strain SAG46.84" /NCGR_SAMPLE_ID=MMETSP1089 /ASSEMBLY_ACC=CAM_ASM_000445 /LENGTH=83 /DNA_ID=CAMNT_0026698947 /DNA_START=31 /DNA_END=279 /DNA_ORIENTATION=+